MAKYKWILKTFFWIYIGKPLLFGAVVFSIVRFSVMDQVSKSQREPRSNIEVVLKSFEKNPPVFDIRPQLRSWAKIELPEEPKGCSREFVSFNKMLEESKLYIQDREVTVVHANKIFKLAAEQFRGCTHLYDDILFDPKGYYILTRVAVGLGAALRKWILSNKNISYEEGQDFIRMVHLFFSSYSSGHSLLAHSLLYIEINKLEKLFGVLSLSNRVRSPVCLEFLLNNIYSGILDEKDLHLPSLLPANAVAGSLSTFLMMSEEAGMRLYMDWDKMLRIANRGDFSLLGRPSNPIVNTIHQVLDNSFPGCSPGYDESLSEVSSPKKSDLNKPHRIIKSRLVCTLLWPFNSIVRDILLSTLVLDPRESCRPITELQKEWNNLASKKSKL